MPPRDSFGRTIDYLRVSVTDRCNLRCIYCMPPAGVEKRSHREVLRYEELALIVRAAAEIGITKVRLTGGEPLVRLGLPEFVRMIASIPGIDDLSMTTNGTLLAGQAAALAEAGLHRVNISLDTLDPERFASMTRWGSLDDVWAGIAAARATGLTPIKFNVVVIRGLNSDQITDFASKTLTDGWHVRFIEWMPIGSDTGWVPEGAVPSAEVRSEIEREFGPLHPVGGPEGSGPSRYYQLGGAEGTIGFISALSAHCCPSCNRLRVTADGRLRPCLLDDHEFDLRVGLRQGAGLDTIKNLLTQAIQSKPSCHHLHEALPPHGRTMAQIGG
ncbi:MAG TPA: GTP 3',8-cyclase MoaA [Anaerolineae bacterium]|nr:GTP 3',8-cyclase MoaA [Anaerolineae bacterium]